MNIPYAARRDKLRKLMKTAGHDAFLVTNEVNVSWLTGFSGDDSYLLVLPDGETLLSDFRYGIQIEQECPDLDFAIRTKTLGLFGLAKEILKKKISSSSPRLGVESNSISWNVARRVREMISETTVPTEDWVESLRMVKDKSEIALIREAGVIAKNAFNAVRSMLTPNMTEKEIADELEFNMRRLGAADAAFPSIVAVGKNAAKCHAVPGETCVGDAGLLLIDWGARFQGYRSDLTRTFLTGRPPKDFEKIYGIVREAQQLAIDAIQPGKKCSEIDAVARNFIIENGYGDYFDHGLGHGVGRDIHEAPAFSPRCDIPLKPGMVITVEPGIYIKGWGGIRIEDDILVTRQGCEVLTDVEK